jgi:hypothetical protein
MASHEKNTTNNMSLSDAVEALSTIAELDVNHIDIEAPDYSLLDVESDDRRRILTPYSGQGDIDVAIVKNIFKTILHHLKNLYMEDSSYITDASKSERVKSIMVLVGEAANKLDRFTDLFHHAKGKSVHDLREFKQLQEFYLTRVAKKIDESLLGKWILGLSHNQWAKDAIKPEEMKAAQKIQAKHVFIDLEGVKKDTEYELFFIRKEDGTRFFNPRLIRSIKLVCDFGSYFKGGKIDDPFADINLLLDRTLSVSAKHMIHSLSHVLSKFYRETNHQKSEMVLILNKAIMALLLAANNQNSLRNNPYKSCTEYFSDFQSFLRDALQSRDYQRSVAFPDQTTAINKSLCHTVQALAKAFYVPNLKNQDIISYVENIIHEAVHDQSGEHEEEVMHSKQLWNRLASDYTAMTKLIKRHPGGHLKKILEMVEEGNYQTFDPLFQQNTPMELYKLYRDNQKMMNIRLPAPVIQEYIQKVNITEEFKAFLRSLNEGEKAQEFLMFNFQDRTSWREHARAKALEDLQKITEFSENLTVVTLAKDTEFYNQETPYNTESHANVFIDNLREHLGDEASGFYFPEDLYEAITDEFVDQVINKVHVLFFHSKNVLTREQRLDFIEIVYFFLELKVLDIVKPDMFSFTCKDSVDIAGAANANFFAFLKILNQEGFSETDKEFMNLMVYGIPITTRERVMLQDRFNRCLSAIRVFESVKLELGNVAFSKLIKEAFAKMYDNGVLDLKFQVPENYIG